MEYASYENFYAPDIGSASGGLAGNIYILSDADVNIFLKSDHQCPCVGAGTSNSHCGNIVAYSDSRMTSTTWWNNRSYPEENYVNVGAGTDSCSCGDIVRCEHAQIGNAIRGFGLENTSGHFYGAFGSNSRGTLNIKAPDEYRYSNDADDFDPSTMPTTTYNVTTETITTTTTSTTVNETKTTTYETFTETREDTTTKVYEKNVNEAVRLNIPLIIHTGPKANEELRVYIEDMGPEALGIKEVRVDPREAALKALDKIDNAIEYALDQATQMGAYIARLEQTEDNLVTASENTQYSESTIRDADMAKEMTAYMRDNILSQSAQSMLAQANQSAGSVLSLLQ